MSKVFVSSPLRCTGRKAGLGPNLGFRPWAPVLPGVIPNGACLGLKLARAAALLRDYESIFISQCCSNSLNVRINLSKTYASVQPVMSTVSKHCLRTSC